MSGRYETAVALRRAIEDRLRVEARRTGRDLNWLRRRLVFARLLARLMAHTPSSWVLKGGMAVEVRRPGMARSTRDVDLVLRPGLVRDPADHNELREALVDALSADEDGDRFTYTIGPGVQLRDDAYGPPAWRFHVEAVLAGRRFSELRLDIVVRSDEIGGTELRKLPDVLGFAGISVCEMVVADLRQQYAEKLHALTRIYQAGRSSRVKDLVDLVLLIEDGVLPDEDLVRRVRHVFGLRQTHPVPGELGPPPATWHEVFQRLAAEVELSVTTPGEAGELVAEHWRRALAGVSQHQGSRCG